ncbi:MAG: nitroreductase family protein [Candidatus Marinimicrobia bacterium]|nr:nitroreductase family protein [Candidatus Neomarinimicrobiota bacterium]
MNVFDAIKQRYSYRGPFAADPIPRADLVKIVQAGLDAPSGCNAQSTSFVVVDALDLRDRIAELHVSNQAVQTARAFIFCVVNRDARPVYQGSAFEIEDCAAAVENMLLAITALGYASVWIDGWLRAEGRNAALSALLGLPADKIVRVMLPVGKPVEPGPRKEKKPLAERVGFNGWLEAD